RDDAVTIKGGNDSGQKTPAGQRGQGGPGAPGGGWTQALHPLVIKNPKGGYLMLYNSHSEVYAAASNDGKTWDKLGKIGLHGADVDGYFQEDGSLRLYYGDFTEATGGLVY